jgi:hypothetical protein
MTEAPFPVWPTVRVPMGARMRIFSDVLTSMQAVTKDAPRMRQRRQFRLAMEKRRLKKLRLWRENVR